MKVREVLSLIGIGLGFLLSIHILWKQEFRHYLSTSESNKLVLYKKFNDDFLESIQKPVYIHYFDQDCKSSRVNIQHIEQITHPYKNRFSFFIINISSLSDEEFINKYDLPNYIKVISDDETKIVRKHKVSTTPYALILSREGRLIFKGNYTNNSGLCGPDDIKWSAPSIAMKFISANNTPPTFSSQQTRFSGCEIKQL